VPLELGDILFNRRYRIQRQLGSGGFGSVYLAQDTLLREEVAIKELAPGLDGDQAALSRFLAEAKATMRLRHERIVGTHNVFSETGHYYIVMEYLAGDSLEARLKAGGPLPVEDAVHIAGDVAEGLAYAHERGVVHCDLKPANILFTAEGHAKVADFGIAHIPAESLTRTWATPAGFVAGTVPYMSPEQADGVRDDPRVDVYALGAVLYRMLTGRPYLDFDTRETPAAQARNVRRIQTEAPVPPSTYNRRVPGWLDAAVLKALAKRPDERYSGAAPLGEALLLREAPQVAGTPAGLPAAETVLISKRPTSAPPASSVRRGGLPAWFWPGMGGAVVLLVLVVVVTAWVSGREAGRPPVATPAATLAQAVAGQSATSSPASALFGATATPSATRSPTETVPSPTGTSSVRPTGTSAPTVTFAPTAVLENTVVPSAPPQTVMAVLPPTAPPTKPPVPTATVARFATPAGSVQSLKSAPRLDEPSEKNGEKCIDFYWRLGAAGETLGNTESFALLVWPDTPEYAGRSGLDLPAVTDACGKVSYQYASWADYYYQCVGYGYFTTYPQYKWTVVVVDRAQKDSSGRCLVISQQPAPQTLKGRGN
jgi:eukaryotic-like serine/threonine-protein kinase